MCANQTSGIRSVLSKLKDWGRAWGWTLALPALILSFAAYGSRLLVTISPVLNRVPPRSRLTEDIAADLASAGTPIAATRIGNRVALAQATALGFGVIENARMTPAAAEISALAEEIRGALSGLNPRLKP